MLIHRTSRDAARRALSRVSGFGLALLLLSAGGLYAQVPSYVSTTPDDVTGNNLPRVVNHPAPQADCPAGSECYLPDPGADSYGQDLYERPVRPGRYANTYHPAMDIVQSQVGYDDQWLYYRIEVYGPEGGVGLPYMYGFEINYDDDNVGDVFVTVDDPGMSTTWTYATPVVYWDADDNVGATNPTLAEGPGGNGNGYERKVFIGGLNKAPGSPGGVTAVQARVAPGNPAAIELAVKRVFMEELKGGVIERAAFRPFAGTNTTSPAQMYFHDELSRTQAGSPYPWLTQTGAPATCPHSAPITSSERAALESGTDHDTGIYNPCYPSSGISQVDNGGTASALSEGTAGSINFYADLAVTQSVADTAFVGDTLVYSIVVDNHTVGFGEATGVFLFDSIPSTGHLVDVTPAQGSCQVGGESVTCDLGAIPNGTTVVVEMRLIPGAVDTVGFSNRAWVVADPTDDHPEDDASIAHTVVLTVPGVTVVPDGTSAQDRVPGSAGYSASFEVSHTAHGSRDLHLHLTSSDTTVLVVDSITGPLVTPATSDSAMISKLPHDSVAHVMAWYRVLDVPEEAEADVRLTAATSGYSDFGWVDVRAVRPGISINKSAIVGTDPAPGADIEYRVTVENVGTASAEGVMIVDEVPVEVAYKIGTATAVFEAGLQVSVQFSADGGATWSYVPASSGCGAGTGYDGCVDRIRWVVADPLPHSGTGPSGGQLAFTAKVL